MNQISLLWKIYYITLYFGNDILSKRKAYYWSLKAYHNHVTCHSVVKKGFTDNFIIKLIHKSAICTSWDHSLIFQTLAKCLLHLVWATKTWLQTVLRSLIWTAHNPNVRKSQSFLTKTATTLVVFGLMISQSFVDHMQRVKAAGSWWIDHGNINLQLC